MKAIKQVMSLIISCILSASVLTTNITFAEGSENPDLLELAFSLGADTDYLNIANYRYESADEIPEATKRWFIDNAYNMEVTGAETTMLLDTYGGMCFGIAVIEVLAHNGVISPSDIVPGAEKLCDIEYCDEANVVIAAYHSMQSYFEVEYYTHEPVANLTLEEQVDDLIALAERNMAENKYFLVTFHSATAGHAVAGVGIADGKWEFEGKTYDKCILTLDSNSVTEDGVVLPFHEKTNIYVDSNTKDIYIPAYADGEKFNELSAIYGFDDFDVLNYRGIINPSTLTEYDFSEAITMKLSYIGKKTKYDVTIKDKYGNEYPLEEPVGEMGDWRDKFYFIHGSEFYVTATPEEAWPSNPTGRVDIKCQNYHNNIYGSGDATQYEILSNSVSVTPSNKRNIYYEFTSELNNENYYQSPYYKWLIYGNTHDKVNFEFTKDGMIISGADSFDTDITVFSLKNDEDGQLLPGSEWNDGLKLYVTSSILAAVSDDSKLVIYIDPDRNGIYDEEVEKGDVNCDGLKDAADASLILYDNAQVVDKYDTVLDRRYADVNGDGIIDSVDASLILVQNAEQTGETA